MSAATKLFKNIVEADIENLYGEDDLSLRVLKDLLEMSEGDGRLESDIETAIENALDTVTDY
jgi:hypothetical protein